MEKDKHACLPPDRGSMNDSKDPSIQQPDDMDDSTDWDPSKQPFYSWQAKAGHIEPIDLNSNEFSLDHDAKQGYKPDLQNIQGPLPFLYLSHSQPRVIEALSTLGETCIYKSKRPANSFNLHQRNQDSGSRYEVTDPSFIMLTNKTIQGMLEKEKPMPSKHKNSLPELLPKAEGIAATVGQQTSGTSVVFEADFEHANLDLAFWCPDDSFTLLLRPDTNSKGHSQWFYFKVSSPHKKVLRFNIINLVKPKSIFGRGGYPYLGMKGSGGHPESLKWTQLGDNCKLAYARTKSKYDLGDGNGSNSRKRNYMTLSFEANIEAKQELWFAYSIPYSYSDLLGYLDALHSRFSPGCHSETQPKDADLRRSSKCSSVARPVKIKVVAKAVVPSADPQSASKPDSKPSKLPFKLLNSPSLKMERLCKSESLLDVPILLISDFAAEGVELIPESERSIVYIVSRVHPSESVSSYSVEGLINKLLDDSTMSKLMRKLFVFKIVPMMNPDGVIIGNFRTNFSGEDLNRRYDTPSSFFHPSVFSLRQLLLEDLKANKRIYAMMDFHGHSCRRNVFIYGPKVTASSQKSIRAKSLGFLLSTMTEMFRFQSCIWNVSKNKKRTLRGVFLGLASTKLAFTFEHSTSGFDGKNRRKVPFTDSNLRDMGRIIMEAFSKHTLAFIKIPKVFWSDFSGLQLPAPASSAAQESQKATIHQQFMQKLENFMSSSCGDATLRDLKGAEQILEANNLISEMQKWEETEGKEDDYSEGGSDSEFSDEDLDNQEHKVLNSALVQYSKAYSSQLSQSTPLFAKQVKKELNKAQKRKKRTEMEEFMRAKQLKARFESLEKYTIPEQPKQDPARTYSKTPTRNSSKVWIASLGTSLKHSRLNRDMTMPLLRGSVDSKLSQKASQSGLDVVRLDNKKSVYNLVQRNPFRNEGPQQLKPTIISSVRESELPTSPLLNKMSTSSSTTHIQNRLEYFNMPARLERRPAQVISDCQTEVQREGVFGDLFGRDMKSLRFHYHQELERQKLAAAKALQSKRVVPELVPLTVQTLELRIGAAPNSFMKRGAGRFQGTGTASLKFHHQ